MRTSLLEAVERGVDPADRRPGALIGALSAWLLFNALQARPLGASFRMPLTPALALLGLGWALCIGAIAALLPAVRAARVPVTVALRAI